MTIGSLSYPESMTQRITVSLPDDLAARAKATGNASAYVAEALRNQSRLERDMDILAELWGEGWDAGISDSDRERASHLHGR
ncbi:hypothetical protein GCM10010404_90040 [Nonomuraea africana]